MAILRQFCYLQTHLFACNHQAKVLYCLFIAAYLHAKSSLTCFVHLNIGKITLGFFFTSVDAVIYTLCLSVDTQETYIIEGIIEIHYRMRWFQFVINVFFNLYFHYIFFCVPMYHILSIFI